MRRIYLIRHAMPDIPLGERWCVGGRSDFPLGRLGRIQAARLPFTEELEGLRTVFASPLVRAIETARPLCAAPQRRDAIREMNALYAAGGDHDPVLTEARKNCPRKLKGK